MVDTLRQSKLKINLRHLFSRIRDDTSQPNSINMWIVSDNLLKGAALNAVEIAETLINNNFYGK